MEQPDGSIVGRQDNRERCEQLDCGNDKKMSCWLVSLFYRKIPGRHGAVSLNNARRWGERSLISGYTGMGRSTGSILLAKINWPL